MASKLTFPSTSEEESILSPVKNHLPRLFIKNISGQNIEVDMELSESVEALKQQIAKKLSLPDPVGVQLVFQNKELEKGTLSSNGLEDGSLLLLLPRLRSGQKGSTDSQMANIQRFMRDLADMLPEQLQQPITISFPLGNQTVTLNIEPKSRASSENASSAASAAAGNGVTTADSLNPLDPLALRLPERDEDDADEPSAEEAEHRRVILQRIMDQTREDAIAARAKATEHKRTVAKLEDLHARMRAKRANRDKACHATSTLLPSGKPASLTPLSSSSSSKASSPSSQQQQQQQQSGTAFAGLKRGFLLGKNSKSH